MLARCLALGVASSAPVARAPAPSDCEGGDSTNVLAHGLEAVTSRALPAGVERDVAGGVTVTSPSPPCRSSIVLGGGAFIGPNEINGEAVTIGARWEANTDRETPRFFDDQRWAGTRR